MDYIQRMRNLREDSDKNPTANSRLSGYIPDNVCQI